jgi:hypothetical protein
MVAVEAGGHGPLDPEGRESAEAGAALGIVPRGGFKQPKGTGLHEVVAVVAAARGAVGGEVVDEGEVARDQFIPRKQVPLGDAGGQGNLLGA